MLKKTILIDLDGVLNTYNGSFDEKIIPPIKTGAREFIKELSEKYKIKIFTTRNRLLTSKWITDNGLQDWIDDVTNIKELCHLIIDDRCIGFNGDFGELKKQIENLENE